MAVFALNRLSDEKLVELAQKGNLGAVECLLREYSGMVIGKAKSFFAPGVEKDDFIQEGMLGVVETIRTYRPEKGIAFGTFLSHCLQDRLVGVLIRCQRQKHRPLNQALSLDQATSEEGNEIFLSLVATLSPDPLEEIIDKERRRAILRFLDQWLSKLERAAIELYIQGESYATIAQQLREEKKVIDNALNRAKRKIRRQLELWGMLSPKTKKRNSSSNP